jgi:hypothetical protein
MIIVPVHEVETYLAVGLGCFRRKICGSKELETIFPPKRELQTP